MALTDDQRAQARLYLGYSDASRGDPGALEGALSGLSAAAEPIVAGLLTALASIDAKLTGSWDRQKVLRAEEVTLAGEGELRALRGEGSRLVRRLAATLGVPVASDPFRTHTGDASGVARRGA